MTQRSVLEEFETNAETFNPFPSFWCGRPAGGEPVENGLLPAFAWKRRRWSEEALGLDDRPRLSDRGINSLTSVARAATCRWQYFPFQLISVEPG